MFKRLFCICCCALPLSVFADGKVDWAPILEGEHRIEKNAARDQYRHPRETLEFFKLAADQHVVEIWPGGGGWYTEILAPLLRKQGKLIAAHFDPDSHVGFFRKSLASYQQKLAAHPDNYDRVVLSVFQPPQQLEIAPEASADRVLTFRNVHNWMKQDSVDEAFMAFYKALKPGGILGVVEHRAKPGTDWNSMIQSGYVTEEAVKQMAKKAGFVFVAASNINANEKDSADHPKGVWTLPPTLRLGDVKREYYLGIGESDRMTLKFMKPAND